MAGVLILFGVIIFGSAIFGRSANGGLLVGNPTEPTLTPEEKIGPGVVEALTAEQPAFVVIALTPPPAAFDRPLEMTRLTAEIRAMQTRVLAAVATADFEVNHAFTAVPALSGWLHSAAALNALANHPDVRRIDLDVGGSGGLDVSVPLIGADAQHALGYTGSGVVVAVLDSGLDTDHSDLASSLIHQACFLDNDNNINGIGLCPNGSDRQFGSGAAEDGAGHGTHVTGIVTSDGIISSVGVAPGAGIVAVKVLDDTPFSGRFYTFSEIVAALDYILVNRPDVQVINMSLVTSATWAGDCDNTTSFNMAGAAAINLLRANGVIAFASSGNVGSGTNMSSPACLSNVVSVGATNDNDIVASFTNSNSVLDVMAPGVGIVSDRIGNTTTSASGTSMASPHAAGCAALLIQSGEAVTPAQIELRLETSSIMVVDPTNGLSFPRIDCHPPPATPTPTASHTPTLTHTPTPSGTPTMTPTATATISGTVTPTVTWTPTVSGTISVTVTPTGTMTITPTPGPSPTRPILDIFYYLPHVIGPE